MRLTKKMLYSMRSALNSALSGEGFDGGDFADDDQEEFIKARRWITQELEKRENSKKPR